MPPAKKVAEKPVQEDSEQSTEVVEVAVKKKVAKKIAPSVKENIEDPISMIAQKDIMVYMNRGESYFLPEAEFTRESPFVLMNAIDALRLINNIPNRFVYATKEQVQSFYSLG